MISQSKILALTIGPKSLFLAELASRGGGGGGKPAIIHLAEFPYPENLSLSTPTELGNALAQFLKSQKEFSTRDTIIGLPARRLITRRKDVPPASHAVAASALRLQAETEFSSLASTGADSDTFVADFAGQTATAATSSVLLIATAQSCVDQCIELAKAAHLRLRGITASSAALARATNTLSTESAQGGSAPADELVLSLSPGAAELVVQHGQSPTQLRHIAWAGGTGGAAGSAPAGGGADNPDALAALAGEIRRSVASLQRNGAPLSLALWEDSPTDDSSNLLEQRLGMPVTSPNVRSLAQPSQAQGLQSLASRPNAFAPAIAVALSALSSDGLPVDFLHSRLAPPRQPSKKRPLFIGISIAAVVLLLIIAGFTEIHLKQNRLDELHAEISRQADQVKVARTASNRLATANSWIHRSPEFIPCLRDITALFPEEGTIWATSLSLNAESNKGVLTGKAAGEPQVRTLKNLMLESRQFLDPTFTYQEATRAAAPGTSPEISFSLTFTYRLPEPKAQPKTETKK